MVFAILVSMKTTEQYNLLNVTDRSARYLTSVVTILNAAEVAGSIPNPSFKDGKDSLNRLVDALFFCNGPYYNYDLSFTSSSVANNRIKAAEKMIKTGNTSADIKMFVAAATQVKELHDAFEALKGVVVKRAAKSEEERAADYIPPMPTSAAAKLVEGILKSMTNDLTKQYADYLHNSFVTNVETFKPRTREEKMKSRFQGLSFCESQLMPLVGDNWDSINGNYMTLKLNFKAILRTKAESDAHYAQRMFLYKNVMKLATILENKGNYTSHEILHGSINSAGFQGEIVFSFADGAKFTVRNKVVSKYSIHDRGFLQFPTTFHNAVLPSGRMMPGQPSQEEMIEVFAAKK